MGLLVLGRRERESIKIGDDVTVTVERIGSGKVSLSFDAPAHVKILRSELLDREPERSSAA